jgi:replicative DNA helicase
MVSNSTEVEMGLVGLVTLFPHVEDLTAGINANDFTDSRCGTVWGSLKEYRKDGTPFEPIMFNRYLRSNGVYDQIGGAAFIADCHCIVPNSGYAQYLIREFRRDLLTRRSVELLNRASGEVAQNTVEALAKLQKQIDQLTATVATTDNGLGIDKMIEAVLEEKEEQHYYATNYFQLDESLGGGLSAGSLTILAGAPSCGKSAMAINMILNTSLNNKPVRCLYICQEMTYRDITARMIAIEGRMPISTARNISMGKKEGVDDKTTDRYIYAGRRLKQTGHIIKAGNIVGIDELKALAAMYQGKVDMVIVDYLQQLRGNPKQTRLEITNEASWTCKDIALRYNIPVIALSQLNREGYKNGQKPDLSSLRESGQIEQDADNVWLLWREKAENTKEETVEVNMAKNRNGAIGRKELTFDLVHGEIKNPEATK